MKTLFRYFTGCLIAGLVCLTATPSWAISYVGGDVLGYVGQTGAAISKSLTGLAGGSDAAPVDGDLVIVSWCVAGNATPDRALTIKTTGGTDYTLLGSEMFANDGNTTNLRVAYRFMTATPDTTVEVSEAVAAGTGAVTDAGAIHIGVFRSVNATPLEQAVQLNAVLNTMVVDPGSITPTTTGTYIYVVGCGSNSIGAVHTSGDLTDFRSATAADNTDATIGGGYHAWTSGTFSPATYGGGGTDGVSMSHAWLIVALAPAAAVEGFGGSNCGALMLLGVGGC